MNKNINAKKVLQNFLWVQKKQCGCITRNVVNDGIQGALEDITKYIVIETATKSPIQKKVENDAIEKNVSDVIRKVL